MTQTARPATTPEKDDPRGLAARVNLGRIFRPVSSEFLLIASTALLLTVFGLVMVLSATSATAVDKGEGPYDIVMKQGLFALVGVPLMFLLSRLPVAFWKKVAWPALIITTGMQLLVFTPLGVENDGNQNWILIAGQNVQPSEFLKLTLALWCGYVLYRKRTLLTRWQHVFIPLVPVAALVIGTVMGGHDLGTAMILFLVLLGTLFFSGVRLRIFILPLILSLAAVAVFALTSDRRMSQIASLFNTDNLDCYYAAGGCWQQLHAIWGMASGGVFGLGLGNSREKYGWLPAASNDYIFAIVGEELGLIGCGLVLALFALFAVGVFHVIRKTDDPFVRIVSGGIVVWVIGQALINIGVVLRIFPVLGVPLPFMSQGGTSLVSVLLACGVLLSFARTIPAAPVVASAAPVPAGAGRDRGTGTRGRVSR